MPEYDKIYRGGESEQSFQLATGYISTTTVFFENEGILARIKAEGSVTLLNSAGELLAEFRAPRETEGRGVYEQVLCSVKDRKLLLRFPVVQWIDNYPNCDGEHDRWDSRIVGYYTVEFDPDGIR